MNELQDKKAEINQNLANNSDLLPFEKMSPRFVKILKKHNVRTYFDLAHFVDYDITRIRGCGKTISLEAQCVLEKKGMPMVERKPCDLTMRDRVIASMFLTGETSTRIGTLHGITYQRAFSVFHRVRNNFFHCDDDLGTMRKKPDTYLRQLLPFPSIQQVDLPKVICYTLDNLPFYKISNRLTRVLQKYNVQTYRDLKNFAEYQLIQIRGCGKTLLSEALSVLEKRGQSWPEPHLGILTMRHKVIAAMYLCGVSCSTICSVEGISSTYTYKVLHRVRKKFFLCDEDLNEMKRNPDKYLHKLFDFPLR